MGKNFFLSRMLPSNECVWQDLLPLYFRNWSSSRWIFTESFFVPNSVQKSEDTEAIKQCPLPSRGSQFSEGEKQSGREIKRSVKYYNEGKWQYCENKD